METLGCVVLAAGNARRFGANKLTAPLGGRTVIERALDAVPPARFSVVTVVTQYPDVLRLAERYGFSAVRNEHPEAGLSRSVRLGLAAARDCDAVCFMAADQPLLRRESVDALLSFFRQQPECIAALAHGGRRGNPCVFPARFFPELSALSGDVGGAAVIRRHPDALRLLEVPERELWDVDTPQALARIRALDSPD